MVSVTTALRYNPRYQNRSSMYIHGLIPRNFAELAEAVQIGDQRSEFPDQSEIQSLNSASVLAKTAGPDEMPHSVNFIWVYTI